MRRVDQDEYERVFRSAYWSVVQSTFVVLRDRGRAEEVTQDAFVRLYEKWAGAVAIEHPRAWVRRVAVRNAIRRAQRERFVPVAEAVDVESAEGQRDLDLLRAVASLPPQQRAAVALYYLEDLPVDEVAHLLEVAPATVRQHLFRARQHLSSLLGETLEEVTGDVDR
jgi:RNA polymerase sigma-70 factor (ECF subfamily)